MKFIRFNIIFIILIFICVLLMPNIVFADGPSYDITNYSIDAYINENGDMHIDEDFTYYFHSSANGLTRDLRYYYKTNKDNMEPNSARYQASGINNLNVSVTKSSDIQETFTPVSSAENGDSGVYTIGQVDTDETKGYDLKVYSPINANESQTVHYSYDIEDVVVQYNDMCEIYYNFIGNAVETDIDNFVLNVYLPYNVDMSNVKYYQHTYATQLEKIRTSIDEENNCITFQISNIKSEEPVDTRIVFPNTFLMNCNKVYNNDYDFNALFTIEDNMTKGNFRYFLHIDIAKIIIFIAIAIFILLLVIGNLSSKKYRFTVKKADYYRDIPKRLNLLQYQLLLPSKSSDSLNSNLIISTILDLVNKNALNMQTVSNPNRKGKNKYDYNLSLNKEFKFDTLESYENQILSLIFSNSITTKFNWNQYLNKTVELNERFKEISKSSNLLKQINETRRVNLISRFDIYKKPKNNIFRVLSIIIIVFILVFAINSLIINPHSNKIIEFVAEIISLLIFYLLILYNILKDWFTEVKDEYKKDAEELYGLYKYLQDYSLIKDRYPLEVNIWNEYLVFASLFGIANKVAEEFKEELLKAGYTDDQIYITYPVLCMSTYSQSFTSSINSSTGYSGSGSGGGGGRRRGSRSFLIPCYKFLII